VTPEQQMVQEFHEAFGITVNDRPTVPSVKDRVLRVELIEEELEELETALAQGDLVGVADAIGDLLYVAYGTAVTCGLDMEPIVEEIHRSNMTKVGGHKSPTGKWIKPDTYTPPRLFPILRAQGWS